jgi:glycosyltransferase involved in cell wall biosynthesis
MGCQRKHAQLRFARRNFSALSKSNDMRNTAADSSGNAATQDHETGPTFPDQNLVQPQSTAACNDVPVRVRFGVDYTRNNPYQQLLYKAAGPTVEARPATIEAALAELQRAPGPLTYHLHWEDHALKKADAKTAATNMQSMIDGLEALRRHGAQVVWTRHNLRPHDPTHAGLHSEATALLTAIASVIHTHSSAACEVLADLDVFDPQKTVVIAHGSFVGHYPEHAAPTPRKRFGLTPENHVFLMFGRIGPYKQVETAARVFAAIDDPDARLIIAGQPDGFDRSAIPDDDRISVFAETVPDSEVGKYFAAADTVLMPYAQALTSGAAILAAGFSRGILGSDVAGIRDVVRHGVSGSLFQTADPEHLDSAIRLALQEGREIWAERGRRAGQAMQVRGWQGPGLQWRDLFHGLARKQRRGHVTGAALSAP